MSPQAGSAAFDDQTSAREKIAHATLELIAERGLNDVTMSAVAKQAGVARQTLYNHYPDIDTIICAVVESHQDESLQALRAVLATMASQLSQVEHLVRHTAAMAQQGHPTIKQGLGATAQRVVDRYDRELRGIIEEILVSGIRKGELRSNLDPERDAAVVQRMVEATAELVAEAPEETPSIVSTVTATIRAAVAA